MANFFDQFDEKTKPSNFFDQFDEKPVATPEEDGDSTIGSELVRGGKQVVSSIRSGLGALIGSPEEAARAGVQRSEAIAQEAGEGVSLEAVKRAYQEKGLLSAAGEVIDQTPRALASQAAQLALMAGGAKAGAIAGTGFGPVGTIVGGALGAGATLLPQLLGSNVERQASEQMARDKEVDIDLLAAGAGAVGQTALETAAPAFILGKRLVKGLLGITDDAALATAKAQQEMVDAANRSLLSATGRGTARGAAVEIPVEIASSVIERAQAGLDITSPEALAEYGEVAYQSALIGGPLGAASGAADTVLARQTVGEQPTEAVSDFEREREEFARSGAEQPVTVVDDEIDPVDAIAAETPPEPPVELPGGFTVARREVARQEVPEAFGIFPEGSDKPLITVGTPQEVEQKLQSLTQIRKEEEKRLNEEFDKITSGLLAEERKIEVMEATGQAGTDQYVQATALLEQKKLQENEKLVDIRDRIQSYAAPLTFAPIGRRTEVQNEFVVNRGEEPVGVFPSFEAAQSTVEQLAPEAFKQAEQARVQKRIQDIDSVLRPAFAKFNLGDVGLNIVEAIKTDTGGLADGAYARNLIQIAVGADEPLQTMRHETVHALKELQFFTPQQWKVLTERANKDWLVQLKKMPYEEGMSRYDAYLDMFTKDGQRKGLQGPALEQYANEALIEESIADAFGAYDRGNAPPPGMIAALFKKLKNFFTNFGQALRGAGFESADDIFQRIERGELKSRKPKKAEAPKKAEEETIKPEQTMGQRLSLLRKAYPDEIDISTQNPQGVKRIYDPITEMLSIDEKAVREAMEANPEMGRRTIQAIKSYGFVPENTPDDKVLEVFKANIINNLLFLHDKVPAKIRKRSKLWYDGANKIAKEMAKNNDMSLRQVSAILAAMSPQKDWFQNVSMAERAIDILKNQGDRAWTPDMLKYAESYVKESKDRKEREKRQDAFEKIKKVAESGTVLNDMDEKSAAAFVRAYDEAFHSRDYRIVTPEGGFGGLVTKANGQPATMMWSTYGPIEKTVSIFRDGSRENVSEQLGFEHKIRSFYNNIANPNSEIDHVTIDTHAVAAALFEALAGTDTEVKQNFGGTGSSDVLGVGGTYGLIAEAYREAAKLRGIRAREMQSITWEAIRALFNEDIKSTIKPKIRTEWKKYRTGQQSFDATRTNVMKIAGQPETIDPPDWIDSGSGQFVVDGGASYDKSFKPAGGVRLREERELRERLTFNLSAVTSSIPGLKELYTQAMRGDTAAYELLQKVAESSLQYLLKGTGARAKIEYVKGVYLADREPSISVSVAFDERNQQVVMGALAKFADNYNQQQIHVRTPTIRNIGHDFGDGSYATPVYEFELKDKLDNEQISDIINQTGLQGFSVSEREVVVDGKKTSKNFLTTYWVAPNDIDTEFESFDRFSQASRAAYELAGREGQKPKQTVERLYVYGKGPGARIRYQDIQGDLLPSEGTDSVTPRLIAEYLQGEPVKVFKQKDLTNKQVEGQKLLAKVFDDLPTKDLKNPLVRQAYEALNKELVRQYNVMPIKVKLVEGERGEDGKIIDIYKNSAEMRKDVSENNRFKVFKTEAGTFGPTGFNFKDHPLLKNSGLEDADGNAMLFNDVLRAVHDYYAHNLSDVQFGPKGEAAAWRNHMSVTRDPMARWALTAETRAQNAWQNFRDGVEDIPLKDRPFADQKAALPPVNFTFTGESDVDQIMTDYVATLTPEQRLGSLPADSQYAGDVQKQMSKYSLRAPTTPAFKKWFGNSKVVDADGNPLMVYHGTGEDFSKFEYNELKALGSWFAAGPQLASQYSEIVSRGGKSPRVMPVYLSMQNPANEQDLQKATEQAEKEKNRDFGKINKRRREILQAQGFDGVLLSDSFVVFSPNQIKSVTGNVGTYDPENPDIRYSLRKGSPELKQWAGKTTIVDADGNPRAMYHGLAKDTTDFTRKTERGAPIFLTDDPEFAAKFAADSYSSVAKNPEEYLTAEQIKDGVKRAIAAIRKDYGKDSFGKEMIESLKAGNLKEAMPEAREYIVKELVSLLPTGPHIMKLYVLAERPFDYENASHVRRLVKWYKENIGSQYVPIGRGNMVSVSNLPAILKDGQWEAIETDDIQDAIQSLGFDSFYVKEHGRKNLAVYKPNQVKSATGNVGTYSRESNDVRYSLKNVRFPSVKAVKEAVAKTSVPETPEFKRFIAGNQWVDEDDKAAVFYHATSDDFLEFTPAGKTQAIYLSRTPEESEVFGRMAEERRREKIYELLNKDQKLELFQRVLDEQVEKGGITEEQVSEFIRDAKRRAPEYGKFGDFDKPIKDALLELSPARMSIMPLYARAETPFDFRNPDHVARVAAATRRPDAKISEVNRETAEQLRAPTEYPDNWYKGLPGNLKQGFTKTIEQEPVQAALRYLKFDGYISRQNRTSPLSYAVYNPTQLKSVTDNSGEFDREVKNISYSLRSFRKEDLPQKARDYTLPENTLLYHGAYKERADRIEEMGSVLLSRPPMRVSGGNPNEGGLIFFGSEETARRYADSEADPMAVDSARKAGVERLPGKVFETATDRSYELINRNYKMKAREAKALTEALGLPDYKALSAGDSLETAAYRALEYDNSKIDRYEVTKRTGQGKEKISAPWPVIFRTLGVDGFYDSFGVALTANNGIKLVGKDGKLEKYSLPKIPAAMTDRVNEVSPPRIEKGFARRIVEAIAPKSAAHFRAEALNRYNQMSLYDKERAKKMGGAALLADQSAESAALMSDVYAGVVASAMGTDNRSGGIPVLRNGITTIDRSVKGLVASLSPLASYGDPVVYQRYQFWAMVKRSKRLMAQGKNTGITSKDIAFADYLQEKHPEFVDVQKDLINFNNGLVKYMIDTGVLSKERGAEYVKYADYVPFYRQMEGEKTIGPNLFSSISNVRPPKKLKGLQQGDDIADAPLADFLETMVRNTTAAIQAGAKNYAAQRTVNVVTQVKAPGMGATRLDKVSNAPDTFNVLENGEVVSYQTPDELLLYAVKSLNATEIPGMNFFSMPANLLRNLVTRDPGFIIANLMRDSLSAYVTSGQKMTPIVDTVIGFGKALGNMSPTTRALLDAGIISGYDAGNIEESGRGLEKDLAKKAGKRKDAIIFRPFTSLWDGLEKGTTASDAATRAVIYDRVLAETGNEAEALYRALEVMNFHRKGGNTLVRFLTAAIPFFNARLQGLDLFYRASSGNMNSKDAAAIQRKFFMRGSAMMALSVAYYLSVADDEEYKKQEQETKDNNWLFPALGIRIPIPFEVGVLFKVIPERITALLSGRDSAEDFGDSALRNLTSTFGFNPIPQTFKPFAEAYVDYNFFTGRPIISEGLKDVAPEFQVGPGTTVTAEFIAGVLGASPMKVDHIIKGFTGTIGGYALDTIDAVSAQFSDTPRASKRFEQLPVIKRFVSDPEARGSVTEFYKLKESVDTVVRTLNLLEKTNESEAYIKYLQENMGTYAFKDYIRDTERTMKELRGARVAIRASAMSADEKRDALTEISRAESEITMEIKTIKKAIASMQ